MALSLFKKYFLRETQLSSKKDTGVTKANSLDLQAYINQTVEDSGAVGDLPIPAAAGESGQILTLTSATTSEWQDLPEVIVLVCSDETTAIAAGTNKVIYRLPFAMHVTEVRASLSTAQTSGDVFTVDINEGNTSILSTELIFDNGQTSTGSAAQSGITITTAAVISDATIAENAEIKVDVDQIGDGTAKGLKVQIIGYRT